MAAMSEPEDTGVPLERIAWMVTVVVCLVTAIVTLLSGYVGYAAVVFAIACSAAINLR
jgi:ABC-type Fe3+-siderophore transport system permease subunit